MSLPPFPAAATTAADGPAQRAQACRAAGRGEEAINLCLTTLAADPDNGAALAVLGQCLGDLGEWPGAAEALRRAARLSPDDAAIHLALADALARLDDPAGAAIATDHARRLRPEDGDIGHRHRKAMAALIRLARRSGEVAGAGQSLFQAGAFLDAAVLFGAQAATRAADIAALCMQALSLCRGGAPREALAPADKAAKLAPQLAKAQAILGLALAESGQHDLAIAAYQRALALKPDDAQTRVNLAMVQLLTGDFAAGWPNYDARPDRRSPPLPLPRWQGEPLAGRRLLVHAEQGYGDTIEFVRLLPRLEAMGARVVLEVPAPLRRLIDTLRCDAEVITHGQPIPACDLEVALLRLPGLLGLTSLAGDGPYLSAPAAPAGWVAGPGRKVGVVWSGNPTNKADGARSIPAHHLLPALAETLAAQGGQLISLQKDVRDSDRATVAKLIASGQLRDAAPLLGDFADTAAVMMDLDLVIAVDTAVAHLAGALGRPCWVLLPLVPDWRWGTTGADCPIYPGMRLIRQKNLGDWHGATDAILSLL